MAAVPACKLWDGASQPRASPHLRRKAERDCTLVMREETMALSALPRAADRFRKYAFTASFTLHAIALGLLVRDLHQTMQARPAFPPMEVTLVRPAGAPASRESVASRALDHPSSDPAAPSPLAQAPVAEMPANGDEAEASAEEVLGQEALGARMRRALSELRRCDRQALNREERERCEAQKWARASPPAEQSDMDPTGRFTVNREPILSRRPEKGCRLRLTGDQDTMGDPGHTRGGFTCVGKF